MYYLFKLTDIKSLDPHTSERFLKIKGKVWTPYYMYI